ncbi:MAG: tetratricopeptide repeat protein [Terracidiphilus sp.]
MRVCLMAVGMLAGLAGAQTPPAQQPATPAKPAPAQPSNSNPFPEDTSGVPVMPTRETPADVPVPVYNGADAPPIPLPGKDRDPARSPDDPVVEDVATAGEASSSLKGLEKLLPSDDDEKPGKHRKAAAPEKQQTHQELASKDLEIASYYLDQHNWKAAASRFESAMVLDPENPAVYFGLAVAEQHLGKFASARAHYLKVVDYDPDSKQGKEARKALKDPAVANGVDPKPAPAAPESQQ